METKYFMYKEINETEEVLERIFENRPKTKKIFEEIFNFNPNQIVEVSRGTSDNAAIFGKYAFEFATGLNVSFASFSLYTWYKRYPSLSKALVVGISQSGETEDVCEVIKIANREKALTVGITNTEGSTLAKESKLTIFLNAGKENSIAATKTYTATIFQLAEIATFFGIETDFKKLMKGVKAILNRKEEIFDIAKRYKFANDFIVIGRGFNFSTSNELALKLRETSQVNAVSFSVIDFLHGPIASLTNLTPLIFFIPNDETLKSNMEVLEKIRKKGGDILVVSDVKDALKKGDVSFEIPETDTIYYPVINIVFAQLLAFGIAITKKKNPDKPQFLNKITRGV